MKQFLCDKYTVSIILFLFDRNEVPQSAFNNISGEYSYVLDRVHELINLGFVEKYDPGKWSNVKFVYKLTDEGKMIAEEIQRINELADDLSKDSNQS